MPPDKLTPEDKLLNIIEGPLSAKGNRFNANKSGSAALKKMRFGALSFWKEKKFLKIITLQNLNRVVVVTGIFLAGFLLFDYQYQRIDMTNRLLTVKPSQEQIDRWLKLKPSLKISIKESLEEAQRHNIFALTASGSGTSTGKVKEDAWVAEATEAVNQLTLVGVLWETGAPQVMIEETKKGKTHFLSAGDAVDIFKIKTINENSVVLEKNDREWVLR
ncbi:MAG: hypothetical protein ABII88_04425 [Candidatus Omnitrophota bacterium]